MPDRILRGALGAALLVALAGCSEQVTGSLGCPELCSDQGAQLRDTVLVGGVELDTTFTGFPLFGTPGSLTLVSQGDTADVRIVARYDVLPTTFKPGADAADAPITRVDSASLNFVLDSTVTSPAGTVTIEAFDVDTTAADTVPAALLPLFRSDRLLGTLSFQPSTASDTVRIRLSDAALLAKITGGKRLRIGLRLTGGQEESARRLRILASVAPTLRFRVSADTAVAPQTVALISTSPAEIPSLASALTLYTVIARGALPAPSHQVIAVGGLAGARAFLRFDIPPIVLDSVRVIRATLQLHQRASRAPGGLADTVTLLVQPILASPAIADLYTASQFFSRLELGGPVLRLVPRDSGLREIELVGLLESWRRVGTATTTRAIVLRSVQEGELPGEIDFYSSSENIVALRPTLRLTYAPRRGFGLP